MKRAICLILAVIMLASLLLAIVPAVSAAGVGGHHQKSAGQVCAFTDADKDGICDNRGEHCPFVDENGDGICDNHAEHCGQNFADADNDGVGDNRAENGCSRTQRPGPRRQMTEGHHGGGRHGCGRR